MGKKMNLTNLKKNSSKKFTTEKINVDGYDVVVDKVFRQSKIEELLKEFIEKLQYTQDNNIEFDGYEYGLTLTLSHFTSITFPKKYEEQLETYKILIDNEYFDEIYKIFPQEEINKLADIIVKFGEKASKLPKMKDGESKEAYRERVSEILSKEE